VVSVADGFADRVDFYTAAVRPGSPARIAGFWLALIALLVSVMANARPHAEEASPGRDWVMVCTLVGAKWVHVDGAHRPASEAPQPGSMADHHCPCCGFHADALPEAHDGSTGVAMAADYRRYWRHVSVVEQRSLWPDSRSRAPPSTS
jgi:hypothetical protein